MLFMKLESAQREELLDRLAQMPRWLEQTLGPCSAEAAADRGHHDSFSPVEQVWHLADLEVEGFGLRIRRLLTETNPLLPGFDGTAIAIARDYRHLSLQAGLAAFRLARARNLALLRTLQPEDFDREGTQEGEGRITLCKLPGFMSQHDAAHRAEIMEWLERFVVS